MLTAEIYDISEELSAAATLVREGVDVWVTDFRTPEAEEGGLARTLDDHVTAVGDAIDRIRELTRRDVHVAGYSQGGMFAYQCAAHRRDGLGKSVQHRLQERRVAWRACDGGAQAASKSPKLAPVCRID